MPKQWDISLSFEPHWYSLKAKVPGLQGHLVQLIFLTLGFSGATAAEVSGYQLHSQAESCSVAPKANGVNTFQVVFLPSVDRENRPSRLTNSGSLLWATIFNGTCLCFCSTYPPSQFFGNQHWVNILLLLKLPAWWCGW